MSEIPNEGNNQEIKRKQRDALKKIMLKILFIVTIENLTLL